MFANIAYILALVASALWFIAALHYFGFKQFAAAKVLIPASQRTSPLFATTAASLRFLGGMNGAFAIMALALLGFALTQSSAFSEPSERATLLLILAAAHFSQFVFNVPILINGERKDDSYWFVRSGPMLFIFVIDAVETVICLMAILFQF
jgi:hypothetical protein